MRGRLLAVAAAAAAAVAAVVPLAGAGDPSRGALLWQSNQCGTCHTFAPAGSTGKTGPDIVRWLVPQARRVNMSVERFVQSRVTWGGRGMPSYATLGPDAIDDLVSYVLGRSVAVASEPVQPAPFLDAPPTQVADPATVSRWIAQAGLRGRAARGARVFGREGCLSCHTYLGAGTQRFRAGDLSGQGLRGRSAAWLRAYLARPYARGNLRMPAYADLRAADLDAVATFLRASKRRPERP